MKSQAILFPVEIPELLDCLNVRGQGSSPPPQRPLRFPESGAHRLALRSAEQGEPPPNAKQSTGPLHRAPGESRFLPTRPQVSRLHQDPSGGGGGGGGEQKLSSASRLFSSDLSRSPFSGSSLCGVAATLWAVTRVSPDHVEVAPRAPGHSIYTDPQGCGVGDQGDPLRDAGLFSVL